MLDTSRVISLPIPLYNLYPFPVDPLPPTYKKHVKACVIYKKCKPWYPKHILQRSTLDDI